MRLLFAVLFLIGLGLVGYAQLAERLPPTPIGSWPVYAPVSGFLAIDARLVPANAPVEVYVELTSSRAPKFTADRAVLTLTVAVGGKTVLATPLTFEDAVVRDDTPQTPEMIYRTRAGRIESVEAADPLYRFTVGPGDAEGVDIVKVHLVLEQGPRKADPRLQPVGFGLLGIGFIGFVLALRRGGGAPPNPNSQPPPPRWGRGTRQ